MENFKCICDEDHDNDTFKNHFKNCLLFREKFKELDFKISTLLKECNPILIKICLLRYVKMIDSNINKNNVKKERIPGIKSINNNISNDSSLISKPIEPKINKISNKDNINIKKIFIGDKITDEDFSKVTDFCNAKITEKKNNMAKDITKFVKNNLEKSGNEWFVFVLDNKKKIDKNNFDFCLSSTKNKNTMIFQINNYKFKIFCC